MEKVKKWSPIGCVAVLAALLITVWYTGVDHSRGQREAAVAAAALAAETTEDPRTMEQVARQWAQAVMERDGRRQYALMSKKLQAKVYQEMEDLGWVTGTSSPWVENFTILRSEGGIDVIFHYADSTGSAGDYLQNLKFIRENGALKISSISKPRRVDVYLKRAWLDFDALVDLLGQTRETVLKTVGETPYPVSGRGLGFDRTGIRVWFDRRDDLVTRILMLPGGPTVYGVRIGEPLERFEEVLGQPVELDENVARFMRGDISIWIGYDEQSGRTRAVMLERE